MLVYPQYVLVQCISVLPASAVSGTLTELHVLTSSQAEYAFPLRAA